MSRTEAEKLGGLLIDSGYVQSFQREEFDLSDSVKHFYLLTKKGKGVAKMKLEEAEIVDTLHYLVEKSKSSLKKEQVSSDLYQVKSTKSVIRKESKDIDSTTKKNSSDITPSNLSNAQDDATDLEEDEELILSIDPLSSNKKIRAASFTKLVEIVVDPEYNRLYSFFTHFLNLTSFLFAVEELKIVLIYTHNSFARSEQLLIFLQKLFNSSLDIHSEDLPQRESLSFKQEFEAYQNGLKQKIYSFLNDWIDIFPEDFIENSSLKKTLLLFLQDMENSSSKKAAFFKSQLEQKVIFVPFKYLFFNVNLEKDENLFSESRSKESFV